MGYHLARVVALTITVVGAAAPAALGAPVCSDDALFLRTDQGKEIRFSIEIADDPDERAQGLMNRESLPRSSGMLFVYPEPKHVAFWMKNTLIPLDMLFADATGQILQIHSMAKPLDETPIDGGDGVKFVIEINGGLADMLGLTPGAVMMHPSVDVLTAKWPCSHQ